MLVNIFLDKQKNDTYVLIREKGLTLATTYSHSPNGLLPSALSRLTAEFEMGSGVTNSLVPRE
jgi:hypothetical protein